MEQTVALDLARQGVQTAVLVLLPIVAVSLFIGLIVSVFQALTQVQEATLSFAPKLVGIAIVMAFMGNWMVVQVVSFTQMCFHQIAYLGRGG